MESSAPNLPIARHVPALDGIRGIAILAVLVSHAVLRQGAAILPAQTWYAGWWGVDLFFVLSGFLITGILLRTKNSPNRLSSFYARRVLRIFPIYYLLLVSLMLVAAFVPHLAPQASASLKDRLPYFFYFQNLAVLWGRPTTDAPFGHLWSLAVEEQFYLVWPMLVWSFTTRSLLRLSIACCFAALILRIVMVSHFGPHFWIFALTPCRGDGLLLGSIVAILTAGEKRMARSLIASMATVGLAILAFILVFHRIEFTRTDDGPYIYTIGVTGFALTFASLVAASQYRIRFLSSFLEWKLLRSVGKYSYGMYLYHWPLYMLIFYFLDKSTIPHPMRLLPGLVTLALMCLATYSLAWVSYTVFESRILEWKKNFAATRPTKSFDNAVTAG